MLWFVLLTRHRRIVKKASFGSVKTDLKSLHWKQYRKSKRVKEGTFSSMMARYRYILQPGTVRDKIQLGFNRPYIKLQELVLDFTVHILVWLWLVSSDWRSFDLIWSDLFKDQDLSCNHHHPFDPQLQKQLNSYQLMVWSIVPMASLQIIS